MFVTRNHTWHYPTNIQAGCATSACSMTTQPSRFCGAAMKQLNHTSTTVTERHYINRKLVVPGYCAAIERIAPGSERPRSWTRAVLAVKADADLLPLGEAARSTLRGARTAPEPIERSTNDRLQAIMRAPGPRYA